jgi:GNAT superfamily N-acetyltransferase
MVTNKLKALWLCLFFLPTHCCHGMGYPFILDKEETEILKIFQITALSKNKAEKNSYIHFTITKDQLFGFIEGLWVHPNQRRKGLGSTLFKEACKIINNEGYVHAEWCVSPYEHAIPAEEIKIHGDDTNFDVPWYSKPAHEIDKQILHETFFASEDAIYKNKLNRLKQFYMHLGAYAIGQEDLSRMRCDLPLRPQQ